MLEFGFFDTFGRAKKSDLAGAYDAHIAAVQLAEQLDYGYYFFIERQNAKYPVISAPSVYLAAVARASSTIRIGAMVYAVPGFHFALDIAGASPDNRAEIYEFAQANPKQRRRRTAAGHVFAMPPGRRPHFRCGADGGNR